MAAISDYATLKSAVQTWIARTDSTVGNQVPLFVEFAEDRIYNGASALGDQLHTPPLRASVMETTGTVTMTAGTGPLPSTCLEIIKLAVTSGMYPITYMQPERFADLLSATSGGAPIYYTVEAGQIKTVPVLTGSLNITYYQRFPTISPTNLTGPLLSAHGPIYVAATLFEAFTFLQEGELAGAHLSRLKSLIVGANRTTDALLMPGPLRVRSRVAFGI